MKSSVKLGNIADYSARVVFCVLPLDSKLLRFYYSPSYLVTHKRFLVHVGFDVFDKASLKKFRLAGIWTLHRLPHTQTSLSLDENVRAKEGGKENSHGPLRLITSHSRFALPSTMRKTKRLWRRLLHRRFRGQGWKGPISLNFFRISFRNCISCVFHCDDLLSSLFIYSVVQVWNSDI